MKEIMELLGLVQGQSLVSALVIVGAAIFLLIKIGQTLYGWWRWLYNKAKGIESKDDRLTKLEARMLEFESKETSDVQEIKAMVTELKTVMLQSQEEQQKRNELDEEFNRVVMRNTLLTAIDELRKNEWKCSPARKQNIDDLFKCYYANNGDGEIHMLEQNEYIPNVKVDYTNM